MASAQTTNLPDMPPGVFEVGTRIHIKSTAAQAYNALILFPNYADWNPFVRNATVLDPWNLTSSEQVPVEGKRLFLRVQIPPLPLPVDRNTPSKLMNTQFAYENITHVEPELGRVAWAYTPDTFLQAERWQAVSDIGNGTVLYESREIFHGALASTLKALMGENLQASFEAQGEGLKLYLERDGAA